MRNVQLPDPTPTIEGALAVIESESAVVFGRAERVAEACAVLRSHARLWLPPAPTAVVGRLARLLRARSGPLVQPVGELLLSLAAEAGDPWDLLEVALAASDARVVSAALETLVAWVDQGSVDIDLAKAERFAAIVPICGGGERYWTRRMKQLPAWVFHGAKDSVVPLERSKEMVDALKQQGGQVKFTVYPDADHDSWTETYNNAQLYEWLLEQKRPAGGGK